MTASREQHRSIGHDYPDLATSADHTAHHNIPREMLCDERFDPQLGTGKDILSYMRSPTRAPNIILSSEGLTHCLFRARNKFLEFARSVMSRNDETFLIFTFRKFHKLAESSYLYHLRKGSVGPDRASPVRLEKTTRWITNLSRALTELHGLVGENGFVVCDLEKHGGDAIKAFSTLLGINNNPNAQPQFNRRIGLKKASLIYKLQFSDQNEPITPKQFTKARKRILALPEFADEVYDYRLIPYESANDIQNLARKTLPQFLVRHLEKTLELEPRGYEVADLRDNLVSDDDLVQMRAGLPSHLADRVS